MIDLKPAPGIPNRDYPCDWNRILSAGLAIIWLAICASTGGIVALAKNVPVIALALACIWFPEEIGSVTTRLPGPLTDMPITQGSPGFLVRVAGWIVLLSATVVRFAIVAVMMH